jgi:hypothetical protein
MTSATSAAPVSPTSKKASVSFKVNERIWFP